MRTALIALLIVLVCASIYAYKNNPQGCVKLGNDLQVDLPAIFTYRAPSTNGAPEVATATDAQAPTDATASAPVTPPLPPLQPYKIWSPPSTIPAQPNWNWTTVDGQTYSNITINKIEPDAVTVTHSVGVTRIDTSTLPPDIQKLLNYDPEAAANAKAEAQRQLDHPYYTMSQIADAEAAARQNHKPLAWLFSDQAALSVVSPAPGSYEGLTQAALNRLESRTVVIFETGNSELPLVPPAVTAELFHLDDGPIPGGHHYYPPKIVFSSPDATQTFGRVSSTDMKASGLQPVESILNIIQHDPGDQAILDGQPTASPSAVPTPTPTPAPAATSAPAPVSGVE